MKLQKIKYIGKSELKGNKIITDISFVTPEKRKAIEDFFNNDFVISEHEIVKAGNKKLRSYEQLKLWFQIIDDILIWMREPNTTENKMALHESLKRYLPTQYVKLNGEDFPLPKSISDDAEIPMEDFTQTISKILEDFRMEGCEFLVDKVEIWGKII